MPRDRRMSCTAVIGISSQIQRLKKMIGPMTEKTVFVAILRYYSTHFCLWRHQMPRLISAAAPGRQVLCFKGKPVFFIYRGILRKEFETDTCFYCGRMLHKTHHVDHVIPRSFIKSDHLWNFVLACPSCNTRKKDQLPNRQKLAAVVTRNKSMSNSDSSIVRLEFKGYNENLLWQLRFPMPISRRGGHGLIPS